MSTVRSSRCCLALLLVAGCVDLSRPANVTECERAGCGGADGAPTTAVDGGTQSETGAPPRADGDPVGTPDAAPSIDAPGSSQEAATSPDATPDLSNPGTKADGATPPDVAQAPDAPPPVNQRPTVNAGPDVKVFVVGPAVTLAGSATDDGAPATPGKLTVVWSKVSGPGTVTFANAASASTTATFTLEGTYVLRLSADDGALAAQDDTTITLMGLDVGLAGLWRLDDGAGSVAKDDSGGANPSIVVSPASWTTGKIGGALDVSGNADYAAVTDPASGRLDFGTGDFTLCFWVKTTQVRAMGNNWPELVTKVDVNGGSFRRGYEIILAGTGGGSALFQVWSGVSETVFVEAPGINDGKWHHLVGRKTATEVAIYADGVRKNALPAAAGSTSNTAALYFGGVNGDPVNDFDGQLDDVRIYSRALSEVEIQTLATGISP